MTNEKRSDKRVSVNFLARWDGSSGMQESRIEDVSLGGCFVNTSGRVELGQLLSLEVRLSSGKWLKLHGKITSYQPGIGFGLQFESLTDEQKVALNQMVS